jgi:hypothetical protein
MSDPDWLPFVVRPRVMDVTGNPISNEGVRAVILNMTAGTVI